tara:strand:- start:135 stop:293 length:159 start_codon:yes stop_codon:yes gene_type:complete
METRELHIATFNTTTPTGLRKAVKFESENPNYKLINSRLDFTWYFEKEENNV